MKKKLYAGTTSFIDRVFIRDTSVTSRVAGKTGLAWNTAGLSLYWIRAGDTSATAVTLATATLGTWTSGGFKEVDATNMPGVYELGIPNAAIASGATGVSFVLKSSSGDDVPFQYDLDAVNYQDSAAFGLSRLDAAISSRSTYAGGDTSGTTTLLARLTSTRATNLDNLDAAVSSRSTFAGGAVASVTAAVTVGTNNDKTGYSLNLSQTGLSPRALDAVADASLTVGDALVAAIAAAAGKESVSGTTYLIKTPYTGTIIRSFTLDSSTAPTSRT